MESSIYEGKRFKLKNDCSFGTGEQFVKGEEGTIMEIRYQDYIAVRFDIQVYAHNYLILSRKTEIIPVKWLEDKDFLL